MNIIESSFDLQGDSSFTSTFGPGGKNNKGRWFVDKFAKRIRRYEDSRPLHRADGGGKESVRYRRFSEIVGASDGTQFEAQMGRQTLGNDESAGS